MLVRSLSCSYTIEHVLYDLLTNLHLYLLWLLMTQFAIVLFNLMVYLCLPLTNQCCQIDQHTSIALYRPRINSHLD